MKLVGSNMNNDDVKKKGRPKKEIVKFSSLDIKEYCCLPGGEDLYMKMKKGAKTKNCIVMQTGKVVSLPLDQVVHRVDKTTIKPAMPELELKQSVPMQEIVLQPPHPMYHIPAASKPIVDVSPDVFIDLDGD